MSHTAANAASVPPPPASAASVPPPRVRPSHSAARAPPIVSGPPGCVCQSGHVSTNFDALMDSPGWKHAEHVAYSVRMLGDITAGYDEAVDREEFLHARCMIDAFYVHLRLLADFLMKSTKNRDFGPEDFGIVWTGPETPEANRLAEYWSRASTYVVHFGRPRVPEQLEDLEPFQVDGQAFHAMTADALSVFSGFLDQLESKAAEWMGGVQIPNRGSDPDGWRLRVMADQAATLRGAFTAAAHAINGG